MGRPKTERCNCLEPKCVCFRPYGLNKQTKQRIDLGTDEYTAIKLHDMDGLSQKEASHEMKISQPTFARILASAHQKLASAIVGGCQINII